MSTFLLSWYGRLVAGLLTLGLAAVYFLWGDPNSPEVFVIVVALLIVLGTGLMAWGLAQRLRRAAARAR